MAQFLQILVALVAFTSYSANAKPDKVVCYYGSWAVYRPGIGKVAVEDIDPTKCTHAIYTFVGINADASIRILDSWNEIDLGALRRFNDLKKKNPNLKTLIAIGGWNEGSETFSKVASSSELRQTFAENALKFIQTHNFDGFDLDWEYPAQRGGAAYDKTNVVLMVESLRKTFDASGEKYLVTAAVAASGSAADLSYDIPSFSENLDFINLMAYDFHGAFDRKTGQNAPLYPSSADVNKDLNVDSAVKAWIARGAPASKIVLGMGVYGRSFTVSGALNIGPNLGLNTPADTGKTGPYTSEAGMLGYNEICLQQKEGGWNEIWDDEQKVPVTYKGNQWVGYDNERSIRLKAEYAVKMNLGGAMIWSIETEDIYGLCGRPYPLLSTINEVLFGSSDSGSGNSNGDTTPKKPVVTTKATTTTNAPAPNEQTDCTGKQYVRDAEDCDKYYYCSGNTRMHQFNCPDGLFFNNEMLACDWPFNVPACL